MGTFSILGGGVFLRLVLFPLCRIAALVPPKKPKGKTKKKKKKKAEDEEEDGESGEGFGE